MALLLIVAIGLIFCGFGAFVAMIISVVNDACANPVPLLVAAGLAIGAGVILYLVASHPSMAPSSLAQPTPHRNISPRVEAQNVVQTFYEDINVKNYPAAYNLWWNDGRASYERFVAGYSTTVHDDILIDSTTVLDNGEAQVNVTLSVQDTSGARTLRGYYIVGMVNGEWKLLRGHFDRAS
jgi:hypothetical protein